MKRNWDTLRKILVAIEALPTEDSTIDSAGIEGIDNEAAAYHMRLLLEAGLAVGGCRNALGPPHCWCERLTWSGHEFLDAIRRDTVWHKIREIARERGIDLTFDLIRTLAGRVLDAML